MSVPPPHDPFGAAPDWSRGTSAPPPSYAQQPPAAPWQHGPQRPVAGPRNHHLHWWIGGGVLAVVALVAVIVLATVGGSDHTPARPPVASSAAPAPSSAATASPTSTSTPAASLSGLLLPADDINSRMKTPMTAAPGESGSAPVNITVTPANCASAYAPATADGYRGAGYTELAVQGFRGPGGAVSTSVIEAIAKFPDAAAAQAFYRAQSAAWKSCKYTTADATYNDGATDQMKMAITGDDGTTLNDNAFGSSGASCEHAMTVKASYVVDARVCRSGGGGNAGGYGLSIAHTIARNIT